MQTQTAERQELLQTINALPDDSVIAMLNLIKSLQVNDDGFPPHIPNAETAAAIREGRAGKVKSAKTIEEFFAEMHKDDEND